MSRDGSSANLRAYSVGDAYSLCHITFSRKKEINLSCQDLVDLSTIGIRHSTLTVLLREGSKSLSVDYPPYNIISRYDFGGAYEFGYIILMRTASLTNRL